MAEYVKFRLSAAKVGVTMALMALIGGLAEKARAAPAPVTAKPAAVDAFLKLEGIPGESKAAFIKLESVFVKLQSALGSLEQKLDRTYFTAAKTDRTFVKISSANSEFLKIKSANTDFLKIDDANTNFLKIDDANARFLKIDGTAADSSELGGLPPAQYFHGDGGIATGSQNVSINDGITQLLESTDKSLTVSVENTQSGPVVQITNNTATAMSWIATIDGKVSNGSVGPNSGTPLALAPGVDQATVQFLPAVQNQAMTLTVSTEPGTIGTSSQEFVAQLLQGNG